jgi:hypothetical protein
MAVDEVTVKVKGRVIFSQKKKTFWDQNLQTV